MNDPIRGGSKKFYVYVKTRKVILLKYHLVTQQDYQSRGMTLREESHSEQDTIVITQGELNGKQDIGHVISGEQVQKLITKIWGWIKIAFWWFVDLFRTRYEVTVSFNKEWGDADDKSYIVKKISVQKEKHLKFTTEDDEVVEYRSALD